MAHTPTPATGPDQPSIYHIRIKGHLGPRWEGWFGQMAITHEVNGETLMTGPIIDQAALHGMLTKIRDLGLTLLSITRAEPDQEANHRKDTE
jgi:hypothetical protein